MTEPGWYTDPRDSSQYRYWDGTSWTEAVAPGAAAENYASSGTEEAADAASAVSDSVAGAGAAVADQGAAAAEAVSNATDGLAGGFGSVADQATGQFDAATSRFDAATSQFDAATGQLDGATNQLDAATGKLGTAGSDITDRLSNATDGAGGSVAAAFESAATATPLDNPSALADTAANAAGAVQEKAASAIPIDSSAGLSVDEALLDLNPTDAVGSLGSLDGKGAALDGIGQGISVDDVLSDVETPLSDAAETMVVDVPSFDEAPALGDVGIPGDGRSFSSPIDTFGGADETTVIPGAGLPTADPNVPQHTDRFSAPPPTPLPGGIDSPAAVPPATGLGSGQEHNVPGLASAAGGTVPPGGTAPPGGFEPPSTGPFGQPGPGGQGFEAGAGSFGDQAGARTMSAPEPSKSRTPWIVLGAIGLAIVAVLVFLALRSPERTSVDAIAEGQCFADFNQFEATEIRSSVSSADCVEEHALEVFEVTNEPYTEFSEYPGEQVITDLAFRHCLEGFEAFVGTTYENSSLDVWALYPTEGSWNLNSDREVVCMVGAFDQSLTTGTLEGSGR